MLFSLNAKKNGNVSARKDRSDSQTEDQVLTIWKLSCCQLGEADEGCNAAERCSATVISKKTAECAPSHTLIGRSGG
jgi:hypothetical protein